MKISKLNKYRLGNFELKPKHIYAKNKLSLIANKIIKKLNLLELKGGSAEHKQIRGNFSDIINNGLNTIKPDDIIDGNSNTIKDTLTKLTNEMNILVTSGNFPMTNEEKEIFAHIIKADKDLAEIFDILTDLLNNKSSNSFDESEKKALKKYLFNIQKGLFNLQIKIIFRKIQKIDKVKFSPILEIIDRKITLMNNFIDQAYDNDANMSPVLPKIESDSWVNKLQDYLYYKIYKYMETKGIVTKVTMSESDTTENYLIDIKQIINSKINDDEEMRFSTKNEETIRNTSLDNFTAEEFITKADINDVINIYNQDFVNNKDILIINTYSKLLDLLTNDNQTIVDKNANANKNIIPTSLTNIINFQYDNMIKSIKEKELSSNVIGSTETVIKVDIPFNSEEEAKQMNYIEFGKKMIPYILITIGKIALDQLVLNDSSNKEKYTIIFNRYKILEEEQKLVINNITDIIQELLFPFMNISGLNNIDNNKITNTIKIINDSNEEENVDLTKFVDKYGLDNLVSYYNLKVKDATLKFSYFNLKLLLNVLGGMDNDDDDDQLSTIIDDYFKPNI